MPLHQQPDPHGHAQMKDIRICPDFLGIQISQKDLIFFRKILDAPVTEKGEHILFCHGIQKILVILPEAR